MIAIRIGDNFLDLYRDTEISISIQSSFVQNREIALSYVFPFSVPATDTNNKIFGFLNEIPISTLEFKEQAQLYVENMPYKIGTVEVIDWSNERYNIELLIEISQFIKDIQKSIEAHDFAVFFASSIDGFKDILETSLTNTWEKGIVFPEFYAPEFLNGFGRLSKNEACKFINYFNSEENRYGLHEANEGLRADLEYVHCPSFFTKYILGYAADKFKFSFDGNFYNSDLLNELIIFSNRLAEDFESAEDIGPGLFRVKPKPFLRIHEHLPANISIADILRVLSNLFCLYIRYDELERKIYIDFKKNLLAESDIIDYTYALIKGYQGKRAENYYLGLKYSDNIFKSYTPPHCENIIEFESTTLKCEQHNNGTRENRILPIFNGSAYANNPFGLETSNIDKLHFLFWRGLENDENGKPYPRAFFQGKLDSASAALDIVDSPLGIYEQFYKDYINFLNNAKKVKFSLLFNVEDLLNFNIYKKIRVLDVVYIVNSVEITLTMQGMYLAELECYTVVSTYSEPCTKEVTVVIDKEECSKEVTVILEPDNNG